MPSATQPAPVSRGEILSWSLIDWANSAYTTLSITVVMIYLNKVVFAPDAPAALRLSELAAGWGWQVTPDRWGATMFAWGLSLSTVIAALASPVVGAMADARARKHAWLAGTTLVGATAAVLLAVVPSDWAWSWFGLFCLVSLCFELSFGFYNGFLPELATPETMDRVSAWGFSMGYVGGGLALGLEFLVFAFGKQWGLVDPVLQLRVGLAIMGLWWGLFSLPGILVLRDRSPPRGAKQSLLSAGREAVGEVFRTLKNIRRYRTLAIFLLGFLFYNDGIQTVYSQASVFGEREIGFALDELLTVILVFQFLCLPGALAVVRISRRLGQKQTLLLSLLIWSLALLGAYFVTTKFHFWMLSLAVALVMGGTQSVSRAMMAVMTPPRRTAEFFGFYNFSGRATSWCGSFLFGLVMAGTGSARLAILSMLVLFVVGAAITALVDVAQGQREATADEVAN